MNRISSILFYSSLIVISITGAIVYVVTLKFCNLPEWVHSIPVFCSLISVGTTVLVSVHCLTRLSKVRNAFQKKIDALENTVFSDNDDTILMITKNVTPVQNSLNELTKWVTESYPALKKKEQEVETKKQELGTIEFNL